MSCAQLPAAWPEPVIRVQSLSESGIKVIPARYVKPPQLRPGPNKTTTSDEIPVIDLGKITWSAEERRRVTRACSEWGFFQAVNHGMSPQLMSAARGVWREFFGLPLAIKQEHSNTPATYEGYGSRLGVEKGAILDWSDYFFLNYMPLALRNTSKWPSFPPSCRDLITEYGDELIKLCEKLMKILSENLELEENCLLDAFGGKDNVGATFRANFYPKCPQPDLTLGLSSHSDPGGLTILLPDEAVPGLQVRRGDSWITVKPIPDAFIVNIGDQIQVLSNSIYKSVEHRVIVNSLQDRVSLAFFYNPDGDVPIGPVKKLATEDRPALYKPVAYNEYRLLIRQKGPCGKSQVESLKATR